MIMTLKRGRWFIVGALFVALAGQNLLLQHSLAETHAALVQVRHGEHTYITVPVENCTAAGGHC